ncbi:hypothetical protein F5Y11DRAFT_291463 [Daldinia sp. FL1419]|nr:hypothetical protein F5Y11DRAFT_291463 [Daldinia sp. FL1419]
MAIYHIRVRNYHWAHQNIVVQSPILSLDTHTSALIIRPLEGVNFNEPRILNQISDLKDDITEDEYQAEAHGIFISSNQQHRDYFPIWVTVHSHGENKIHVTNLKAFEASNVPIKDICWVPCLEAPDGSLYTVIGAPRKTFKTTHVLAITQSLGKPREARLVLVEPDHVNTYQEIDDNRKRHLFEIQRTAIRANTRPSEFLLDAYRVFASPYRHDRGRLTLGKLMEGGLEIHRSSNSNYSPQDLFENSDDDEARYTTPTYVSIVDAQSRRPYDCDCKYSALRPTCFNPRPGHRHSTDDECALGSSHMKHCIFADHDPTECILTDSNGTHKHCIAAPPEQMDQSSAEESFEQSYYASTGILFNETDLGTNEAPGSMDRESIVADSPFV